MMNVCFLILFIWNIVVMLVYGTDKLFAKIGRRRISEATLVLCAFAVGGVGAMFGMILFNHKTSKMKFRTLVPVAAVLECVAVYLICSYIGL